MKRFSRERIRLFIVLAMGAGAIIIMVIYMLYDRTALNEAISLAGKKQGDSLPPIPAIMGNREGCLVCHADMTGFSKSHDPAAIGCSSCHLGDPLSLDKAAAHRGLVSIPGNLDSADKTCGTKDCHPDIPDRVNSSLMATGRGMVTVNRFVFGETGSPDGDGHLSRLGKSPADLHLKQMCAPCHLGNKKLFAGDYSVDFTGGGCLACHLEYSKESLADLNGYMKTKKLFKNHPQLNVKITADRCFECHNRSARISSNYEGWHETLLEKNDVKDIKPYRIMKDGRLFEKRQADVHHEKGMLCVDCHTATEIMGDGKNYNHQEYQVKISCSDCHASETRKTFTYDELDDESKKIIKLRNDKLESKYLATLKTGKPLINVFLSSDKKPVMKSKLSGKLHKLNPPADICGKAIPGHSRLSCQSCHTDWSPTCVTCHTKFNQEQGIFSKIKGSITGKKIGKWEEYIDLFNATPPALGIRKKDGADIVDSFIPGMVITIDGADPMLSKESADKNGTIFRRLYAPTSSHTTVKKGRSCESCHADSRALGYGGGDLKLLKITDGDIKINFDSEYEPHPADGLPLDSWISPFTENKKPVSTRIGARPFNTEEQKKILVVGRCLACHKGEGNNIRKFYTDFSRSLKNKKKICE